MIGFETTTGTEAATVAGSRREPAPVDMVHLARQTFGSAELEREVLRLFVQQGGGLARLITLAEDARTRGEFAHRLKGSARAIGAMRVGGIAEAIETAAPGEIARLCDELERAVDEVERFVAGLLAPAA